MSWLVHSRARGSFQLLINLGMLKRRGKTGRKMGMTQMTRNSGELLMTKVPSRNASSYTPITWVLARRNGIQQFLSDLLCTSRDQMQQQRSRHRMSQWDKWRDHPPLQTSLLPSLCIQHTPPPPGPQHSIWGGASRRENSRNTGCRVN